MPVVETEVNIPNATLDEVWEVVSAFEQYPETMADVIDVDWLERADDRGVTNWRVLLNGSELTWTETDLLHPNTRIDFEQLDGDLEVWRGAWELEQVTDGVRVKLTVEFDLGVPSLSAVMDPLGIRAIRSNSHAMLATISELTTARSGQQ